jgi:hypothetical protein
VIPILRLGDHELAADQLERLAREHAQLDQPLVLDALPLADGQGSLRHPVIRLHVVTVAAPSSARQCRRSHTGGRRASHHQAKAEEALGQLVRRTLTMTATAEQREVGVRSIVMLDLSIDTRPPCKPSGSR